MSELDYRGQATIVGKGQLEEFGRLLVAHSFEFLRRGT
jgi:hypothetical protein